MSGLLVGYGAGIPSRHANGSSEQGLPVWHALNLGSTVYWGYGASYAR
jgi:hypothetical protein